MYKLIILNIKRKQNDFFFGIFEILASFSWLLSHVCDDPPSKVYCIRSIWQMWRDKEFLSFISKNGMGVAT